MTLWHKSHQSLQQLGNALQKGDYDHARKILSSHEGALQEEHVEDELERAKALYGRVGILLGRMDEMLNGERKPESIHEPRLRKEHDANMASLAREAGTLVKEFEKLLQDAEGAAKQEE